MKDLIEYIARAIVDNPEEVVVIEEPGEDGIVLRLQVAPDDTGKVIGKEGRIAKAMRTLLRVAAIRKGTRASLEIISDPVPPRSGYGSSGDTGTRSDTGAGSDSGPSSDPESDRGYGSS